MVIRGADRARGSPQLRVDRSRGPPLGSVATNRLRRWEDIAQLASGLWLAASPFVFDYAHQDHLRFWHWSLGALVAVLAIFELWQDWHKPPRSRD